MMMEDVENKNIPHWSEQEICAHTMIDISGREWLCINEPHIYVDREHRLKGSVAHYMVNRWPYRNMSNSLVLV